MSLSGLSDKTDALFALLKDYGKVAVALSGGVDSALLLAAASRALGTDKVLAIHARASFVSNGETATANDIASLLNVKLTEMLFNPLDNANVASNPPDRCYHCKKMLMSGIVEKARLHGINTVADGTNVDDQGDYRPGQRASDELEIAHPLLMAGFTKADIRALALQFHLPNHDAPAAACLASRIPYNTPITEHILRQVEKAEDALAQLGFSGHRVRHYGCLAKIELAAPQFQMACAKRQEILAACHHAGFKEAALDLGGYRKGALNEQIKQNENGHG